MTLPDQVTSLEISKRLKELGVKQGSYFYWCDPGMQVGYRLVCGRYDKSEDEYSAFTATELGEIMKDNWMEYSFMNGKWRSSWYAKQVGVGSGVQGTHHEKSETEANSRGKMLIYLLENKLITHD